MKLILLLFLSCLALHNGKGAPTARYMFVRCNPKDNAANCVTYQSPEVTWSPEQPSRLPASSAKLLEAEPVEDERPDREAGDEETKGKRLQLINDEGESPFNSYEYGSGFEGSAAAAEYFADRSFGTAASDTGSGGRDVEPYKGKTDEAKPEEEDLKKEHLLQV